ncbi:MAG: hypothetical protein WBC04_01140 [Candidatus Acidiferrales bacterium]
MIRDTAIARQVRDLMIEISGRLDHSIVTVRECCPPEEFEAYRRAVGRILGEMLEVLNPLYAEHPSLKPPQMD